MAPKERIHGVVYDFAVEAALARQRVAEIQADLAIAQQDCLDADEAAKMIADKLGVDLAQVKADVDVSAAT